MFGRSISLVLIAAVIACPMSCSKGRCHSRLALCQTNRLACDTTPNHVSRAVSSTCPCRAGGCGHSSPTDSDAPCRCPGDSCCQGVCGGAVVERTGASDVVEPDLSGRLIGIQPPATLDSPRIDLGRRVDAGSARARHAGRLARTLYQSLRI